MTIYTYTSIYSHIYMSISIYNYIYIYICTYIYIYINICMGKPGKIREIETNTHAYTYADV